MKRTVDQPYAAYSVCAAILSGICVKCPKCGGLGLVTADDHAALFRCTSCSHTAEKNRTVFRYDVHNQCERCGRFYRVDITEKSRQHFHMLRAACPYCGFVMPGEVHKTPIGFQFAGDIQNAREPFFGFELWFLSYFDGHPVWALNREHLAYLIGYLSADLREKPAGCQLGKTQADRLPAFMKTAKNRERIVKLLKNMQQG